MLQSSEDASVAPVTNEKLWQEYARIRADSLRQERGLELATDFYLHNK